MDKFIRCFACGFETNSKILLRRHTIDHFDNLMECSICSFKSNKSKVLGYHFKRHCKKTNLFECKICGFESVSCSKVKIHVCKKSLMRRGRIYKCFICKYLFNLKQELRKHLKYHNKNILKVFRDYDQFSNEKLKKFDSCIPRLSLKREFVRSLKKCPLCTFETNQKLLLKRHILEHLDKEFKCSYCSYVTHSSHEFDTHMQEHTFTTLEFDGSLLKPLPLKVLRCFKCNFETTSNVDLKEHYRVIHFIFRLKRLDEYDLEGRNDKENDEDEDVKCFEIRSKECQLENYSLKCSKCSYLAKDIKELKLHKRKHYKTQYYKCPECEIETSKRFFNKHLRTHSIKTYNCPFCPYGANKMPHLKRHILVMHTGSDLLKCNECDFETTDRKDFREHGLTHSKQLSQCQICNYITKTIYFKRHLMTHSDVRLYQCPVCDYKAKFKKHLKTHTDIMHSFVKWFQCEHCKYQTLDDDDLKNHTVLNHAAIKCPQCNFQANGKSSLKTHMMVHTNIKIKEDPVNKLFYCSHCKYSTTKISRLQSHILTHNNRFKCSHCDYITTHRGHLNMHLKSHNPTKLLKCPTCSYQSTQTGHMNRHLKIHSSVKLVCCPKCSFRTKSKEYLKHHLETHNPKELKCSLCDYCTNRQSLLRKHVKHHNIS
ncbi:UNVERIFIED_CONTAM: hypothetical protein RMT77_011735 [Armadillidium vulgare]